MLLLFIDFGLNTLRTNIFSEDENEEAIENEKYQKIRDRVYLAPEFVGLDSYVATMEGDVYAFAILLIETATRNDPYGVRSVHGNYRNLH